MGAVIGSRRLAVIVVVAVVGIGAVVGGLYLRGRAHPADAELQAASAEQDQLVQEKAARERMLHEIEKAANATPPPQEPDPSDLPSIDEVLAEDDAGADEPDAE